MKINPNIFKAYDIRGKYPSEINEAVADRIGIAATRFISRMAKKKTPRIMICRDIRLSSPRLAAALIKGAGNAGADIIDTGIGTTPYLHFLTHTNSIDGGIMVTASHNPPEYNGFKISGPGGRAIAGESGLQHIKKLVLQKKLPHARLPGRMVGTLDGRKKYIDFLSKNKIIRHISMIIDAAGGSTVFFLPELLNRFPDIMYKPLFFTPDGSFRIHPPNPLLPQSHRWVQKELKNGKYQCGIIFDGDGDRIAFFDEKGNFVPIDFIFGLLADEELRKNPKSSFVMAANASKGVEEYLVEKGARIVRSRVGYTFVQDAMRRNKAELGVEISGKIHSAKFFYGESGLLAMLRVASVLSRAKRPLSRLIEPFLRYVSSGECNFEVKNPKMIIRKVRKHFRDGAQSAFGDDITIEYPDWWFNIRPSNTEPLVRLLVEAKTQKLLDEKLREIKQLLTGR